MALASLLFFSDAHAQVNTEPFRKRIKATGYSFFLQGTFDGHTGNTRGVTADGLVGAGVAGGRHLAFVFASLDYSKLNDVLGVDKSFSHARYVYELTRAVSWEVFAQAQSDAFQLIKIRDLSWEPGPRFTAASTTTATWASSWALARCGSATCTTWLPGGPTPACRRRPG